MSDATRKTRFAELAEEFDLDNQALAKMLYRTPDAISRYRTGQRPTPPEIIARLERINAAIRNAQ